MSLIVFTKGFNSTLTQNLVTDMINAAQQSSGLVTAHIYMILQCRYPSLVHAQRM
jgi:hypothetical protein